MKALAKKQLKMVSEFWRFTELSSKPLFSDVLGLEQVEVTLSGNFATGMAWLTGLTIEGFDPPQQAEISPLFVHGLCVRTQRRIL